MLVDLAHWGFWAALALALLTTIPLPPGGTRKRALALVNLTFLALLLSPAGLPWVLGFCTLGWWLVRRLEEPRSRSAAATLIGVVLTLLFLAAGLRGVMVSFTLGPFNTALKGVGFSYVLLRFISLTRAVFEGRHKALDWFDTVNYLLPFHMLAAGPIQSIEEYHDQEMPVTSRSDVLRGVERITDGLFKKYVLAESLRVVFVTDFQHPEPAYLFLEAHISYLILYLDFSGYSDIAVGAGRLLGLKVPENFNNPLLARNLIDFWERWHITLSQFIRVNLFVPIQMTLVRRRWGMASAAAVSFLSAFLLCGLWHEISARFVVWGIYHGLGLGICKASELWYIKRHGRKAHREYLKNPLYRAVGVLLTLEFVASSWLLVTLPSEVLWKLI